MKKILIGCVCFLVFFQTQAQEKTEMKAGWGNLDYSVPESPALKILGNTPDNILKPTSVRALAFGIGNYFMTSAGIIPKNMALEISPLLLNSKASLNDYNRNKFLYRSRLSVGTSLLDNGAYTVAEGLRFTLMDRTDLRDFQSNPWFTDVLYATAVDKSVAINKAFEEYLRTHPDEKLITVRDKYSTDAAFKAAIDKSARKFFDKALNVDRLAEIRDSIRNILWNAPIWEIGAAALQSSEDSLTKNLKFSQIGFWSTAGIPIGTKGQLLIGAKVASVDSVKWQTVVSIGQRFFYGSNNAKGFVQAQYEHRNKSNWFTSSMGCQFNVTNGLWGEFSLNLVVDGRGDVSLHPGFNIGFGTPERER